MSYSVIFLPFLRKAAQIDGSGRPDAVKQQHGKGCMPSSKAWSRLYRVSGPSYTRAAFDPARVAAAAVGPICCDSRIFPMAYVQWHRRHRREADHAPDV